MKIIKDFVTQEEADQLKAEAENQGWILVATQHHFDGNHLIFDDGRGEIDLVAEIDDLKARVDKLEKK